MDAEHLIAELVHQRFAVFLISTSGQLTSDQSNDLDLTLVHSIIVLMKRERLTIDWMHFLSTIQ